MAHTDDLKNNGRDATTDLDRAAFDVYEQTEPLQGKSSDGQTKSSSVQVEDQHDSRSSSRFAKISRKVGAKAKSKTEQIFPSRRDSNNVPHHSPAPLLAPPPASLVEDDRLYNPLPKHEGFKVKEVVQSPVSTFQSAMHGKGGAKFAQVMDNQAIAHEANVGLVRAFDDLDAAGNEDEQRSSNEKIKTLVKERQDTYVRWTMDRHVMKVRQDPPRILELPRKEDYKQKNENGGTAMRWGDYGRQMTRYYAEQYCDQHINESSELPAANEEAITTSVERLVMTSMAVQTVLMKVRYIYRWDDPYKTAVYCSSYFLLLIFGHLGVGIVRMQYPSQDDGSVKVLYQNLTITQMVCVLYLVIARWYHPPTPQDLREDIKRSEDIEQTAQNMTQLIEQHGSRGWLDAAIEKLGPASMLQLEDMADALEILRKWAFWKISTDSEWAIARIQAEAHWVIKEIHQGENSDNSRKENSVAETKEADINIGKYHCTTKDEKGNLHHGNIYVTSKSVRFETAIRSHLLWELNFKDVFVISKSRTSEGLSFDTKDEEQYSVDALKGRNELFTQIIGYTGLSWQVSG
ncbi:uncharacterized protein KY384_007559 [Bacidia gigantensis]|uniref:uncharacterized protein n=1 Tax=Bacidia gigantensis TaxID=2732470 RepID=UPI001D058526|nr:uncharacterized protein KY384_007559 [Bacidia gigantensis]KAG8527407.1 hypothetical protein KY384_007559 [Bacidia gigantensis]